MVTIWLLCPSTVEEDGPTLLSLASHGTGVACSILFHRAVKDDRIFMFFFTHPVDETEEHTDRAQTELATLELLVPRPGTILPSRSSRDPTRDVHDDVPLVFLFRGAGRLRKAVRDLGGRFSACSNPSHSLQLPKHQMPLGRNR